MPTPLINAAITNAITQTIAQYSMEIFMFSSGFLFGISKLEISSFSDYYTFVRKKFKRLIVPYFVLSGIILLFKFTAQHFVTIKNPVKIEFWKYIIFNPFEGFATFLWFLYILFVVFIIFPVLQKILRNPIALFVFIFVIFLMPFPSFSYFNHYSLRRFLLVFYTGYLYSGFKFESINKFSLYLFILVSLTLILLNDQWRPIMHVLKTFTTEYSAYNFMNYIEILLGTFVFYYLSVLIKTYKGPLFHITKYLGSYSAPIYLLHTISMGGIRIVCFDVFGMNMSFRPLASILIYLSGIVLPVLITKYIINKYDVLTLVILGVKKVT